MARGYMGEILKVDLSRNELKDEVLDEKLGRQFIGGYGIGVRTIFSQNDCSSAQEISLFLCISRSLSKLISNPV